MSIPPTGLLLCCSGNGEASLNGRGDGSGGGGWGGGGCLGGKMWRWEEGTEGGRGEGRTGRGSRSGKRENKKRENERHQAKEFGGGGGEWKFVVRI